MHDTIESHIISIMTAEDCICLGANMGFRQLCSVGHIKPLFSMGVS